MADEGKLSTREEQARRLAESMKRQLGQFCDFLAEPGLIELMLNADGMVWADRLGQGMAPVGRMQSASAESFIGTVASTLRSTVTRENPILECELPLDSPFDGSRFEALIPPAVPAPVFTIRRKASAVFTLQEYERQAIMSPRQRAAIEAAVAQRHNILVVGGTGTGKTTLTNAVIDHMVQATPQHRIVIIEDTSELQCAAKNAVVMRATDTVDMQRLLKATMRLRPDRIIVGEVRGGEALSLLKAWNTGHPGGVCTVHPVFRAKIREWLKVLRKANCAVVLATQSLSDAARSGILDVLIESCPTKIFLPNEEAGTAGTPEHPGPRDLYEAMGLNETQIDIIRTATKKRHYYRVSPEGRRLTAATSAMSAETGLRNSSGSQTIVSSAGASGTAGGLAPVPADVAPGMGVAAPGVAPGAYPEGFGLPTYPPARVDASAQREKQAFLNQPGDVTGSSDDLQATLRDPSSPFLVMAGAAIPAVMIGGINSDMPGMVIGQVSENVYDTATGRYLLVPQGARLIGSYDNMVAQGQTRVGVIWNRIIYPDTESIDLGSMEGADQGGYAGFHDQVDTHFWSKIGNALLISIAGAGVQLSQGTGQTTNGYNSQQIAAAALGQQFGELGQEYARAGLAIPNTLEIRPGYRFVVMVNKDMHLRPYIDHRTMTGSPPVNLGPIMQ